MTKVDTWLGTSYDIYVGDNGLYYICDCGAIVSPGFTTMQAAWKNGYKYMKKAQP